MIPRSIRAQLTGTELPLDSFNGGSETNDFLVRRGFVIGSYAEASLTQQLKQTHTTHTDKGPRLPLAVKRHNERCPDCKIKIKALLTTIYGKVLTNHRLPISGNVVDVSKLANGAVLESIHSALQSRRGHSSFVLAKTLPARDFYVSKPGFIVEFDESQHFTKLRKETLELYPASLRFGFDRVQWMALCDRMGAPDNDPPYRDEQRAWYDTLRDFAPHAGKTTSLPYDSIPESSNGAASIPAQPAMWILSGRFLAREQISGTSRFGYHPRHNWRVMSSMVRGAVTSSLLASC